MNDREFEQAIQTALQTWYPKDHKLHLNPHHPLGKLLGEWGELLDDYIKSIYKPGYQFDPEDELGDIWYYLRILCYQHSVVPTLELSNQLDVYKNCNADYLLACVISNVSFVFRMFCREEQKRFVKWESTLNISYSILFEICTRRELTLHQLTSSNWEKLKPGSERGEQWMKAR